MTIPGVLLVLIFASTSAQAEVWKEPASSPKVKEAQKLLAKEPPDETGAAKLLDEACRAKDGLACAIAGNKALGANKSKEGVALFELACTNKWPWACFALAEIVQFGKHQQKKDPVRQLALLDRACKIGLDPACEQHGLAFLNGYGPTPDEAKAIKVWDAACKSGSGRACFQLGGLYRQGTDKTPSNSAKAAPLFASSCTAGDVRGCFNGGIMYSTGEGVAEDKAKAARLFKIGCDAKGVEALNAEVQKDLCERVKGGAK